MSRTSYLRRPLAALLMAALAASVVMAVVLASPAQAETLTVNTAADEQNTNTQCSLREAIINANQDDQSGSTDCAAGVGDDTINFNLGSTATITLGSQLPVITGTHPAGLIIDGGSANITISGDNKYRVFEVAFVGVTLSNLTVANGAPAAGDGGGILNSGTLTVSNSTISGNSRGGICNCSGTLTVSNSALTGNSAFAGGGIYTLGGMVTVSNSTLSGNSATNGGGINNNASGTATVSNSTISGNSATSVGGGIAKMNGTLTVSNSTISGNSAPTEGAGNGGGGIFLSSGPATVSSSTISGNSAGSEGGGILLSAGTVTVSNSTISDNSASFGGGINNKVTSGGTSATFQNTIVAANNASVIVPDLRGTFTSQGHNLIGKSDGSGGFTNGQNGDLVGSSANPIDPMLGPLANNGGLTMTHALLEGSPAIDKGVAVEGITTDQRGFARSQGTAPDIGSFESEFTIIEDTIKPYVSTATPTGTGIARGTNIAATFSEEVQQDTLTTANVQLFSGNSKKPVKATLSKTSTSVTLAPSSKLDANTTYRAVVGTGVKDLAGNALDQDQDPNNGNQPKEWTFTTGPK